MADAAEELPCHRKRAVGKWRAYSGYLVRAAVYEQREHIPQDTAAETMNPTKCFMTRSRLLELFEPFLGEGGPCVRREAEAADAVAVAAVATLLERMEFGADARLL